MLLPRVPVALALAAGALLAASPAEAQPVIALQPVATGLARPVAITHAGDGSGRLFITLQGGQIRIHDGTQLLPTPFLDITDRVMAPSAFGDEFGLLSAAFHPGYAANGFFYVHYANLAGDIVIARYQVTANPNVADPGSELILLTIVHDQGSNHYGGQLQFGPDGFLYVAVGDGGGAGDPENDAQSLGVLLGKLLRLDVDAPAASYIPASNPFVATPGARGEIWAYGLRNPWRFSFDRQTGDLFIGDVGQNSREEIDFQPAGSPGGQNYGWHRMEGTLCFDPSTGCDDGTLTLPILELDTQAGNCSIIGGYRYRGASVPPLQGVYLYGDFCAGQIFGATRNAGGTWTSTPLLATSFLISTFGEDQAGELYVARYAVTGGSIHRIVPGGAGLRSKTYTVPPCRVLDTRFASPPGPIAGAAARDVRVVGSLASSTQGGAADCGVPSGATGVFINVVAVGAAGPGHLTAYPAGSSLPLASTINFSTGDTIANGVLVPVCVPFASCAADLTIQMGPAAAHVVVDVTGYLAP